MKPLLLFIFVMVVSMIIGLMIYLGAFKTVSIKVAESGPYRIVFKHHLGPYHKIVPSIEEVERWAVANQEACVTSFGEYFDDPTIIDEDRLNSHGGCVVEKTWREGLPTGLQYREIPRRLFVLAEFDGAPSIGPQKVYPKVADFIRDQRLQKDGSVVEMYERQPNGRLKTIYHFPVRRN